MHLLIYAEWVKNGSRKLFFMGAYTCDAKDIKDGDCEDYDHLIKCCT